MRTYTAYTHSYKEQTKDNDNVGDDDSIVPVPTHEIRAGDSLKPYYLILTEK